MIFLKQIVDFVVKTFILVSQVVDGLLIHTNVLFDCFLTLAVKLLL